MICSVVAIFGQKAKAAFMPNRCQRHAVVNKVQSFLRLDSDVVVNIAHLSKWAAAEFDLGPLTG